MKQAADWNFSCVALSDCCFNEFSSDLNTTVDFLWESSGAAAEPPFCYEVRGAEIDQKDSKAVFFATVCRMWSSYSEGD